jgi:glycosyltransferase involved in cell wall biosynthesis
LNRQRGTWPTRVLITTDTISSAWTYTLELVKELKRLAIDVNLATMGRLLTPEQREQVREAGNPQLFESEYRVEWQRSEGTRSPWRDVDRAGDWLLRIADQAKPNVLHLAHYSHAGLPWQIPVVVSAYSCKLSWTAAAGNVNSQQDLIEYRERVTCGLRAADVVVSGTRSMLDRLEENYGLLRSAMVVPNGRSASLFRPGRKEPFVFAAGRLWDGTKNVDTLADAAAGIGWQVCLAGESRQRQFPNVTALGALSTRAQAFWMSRASIYCLPARYDPLGLSVLEAALSECALVLGDIPTLRELWDGCAQFVAPSDTDGLRDALAGLIADAELRKELASQARKRAIEYSATRMAEGYASAYRGARTHAGARMVPAAAV